MIREVARHFIGEGVAARECRGKDHAGVVAQSFRKNPAILQLRAFGCGLVAHDQRNAGIAQRVDAYRDGQLGCTIKSGQAIGGNAELLFQIERAAASCQLDDVGHIVDGLECRAAVVALDQARDVLVEHRLPQACGDEIDELITAQDAGNIVISRKCVRFRADREPLR